jgi:hypothetical protein
MKPSFQQTVDVLVKAYLNDTLEHGVCTACAVGNIIAASLGCRVAKDNINWLRGGTEVIPIWDEVFISSYPGRQEIYPDKYKGWAKRQIDASGYTWQQLAMIEKAFETHNSGIDLPEDSDDEAIVQASMFNGLMAVVDVLAEIYGIDLTSKEQAKLLFVKA